MSTRPYSVLRQTVEISPSEIIRIKDICDELGLEKGAKIYVPAMYGYSDVLCCYENIYYIYKHMTPSGRMEHLKKLTFGKLRDILARINAPGKIQKKDLMIPTIISAINDYDLSKNNGETMYMNRNGNSSDNDFNYVNINNNLSNNLDNIPSLTTFNNNNNNFTTFDDNSNSNNYGTNYTVYEIPCSGNNNNNNISLLSLPTLQFDETEEFGIFFFYFLIQKSNCINI